MKTIAVIAYDKVSADVYAEQVRYFMGAKASVFSYSTREYFNDIRPADLYLISTCACTDLNNLQKQLPSNSEVTIIQVTIRKESLKQLLKIPQGTKALVVNLSHKMAIETMALFNRFGIDNIECYPCSPNETYRPDITFAVTPGESRYVPKEVTDVLDIGPRLLSGDTVVELLLKSDCEELLEEEKIKKYLKDIVDDNYNFNRMFYRSIRMEGLFDNLQNMLDIGIICIDAEGTVFYLNKKAEEILAVSKKAVVGKKSDGVLPFIPFGDFLVSQKAVKEHMLKIRNVDMTLNITPIVKGNSFVGAMAAIQRFSDEEYRQHKLRRQLMNKGHAAKYTFDSIIGSSAAVRRAKEVAAKMACRTAPVLLTGESGTGKELFAHAIHAASERHGYPFVAINCAAIPDSLMESELFGYEEGAFTGAKKGGKMGFFEFAHRGTLFLDEIEGMSKALQLKLLRVIQEKEVLRIGGNSVINVDVRIIAATNENLGESVRLGGFRKDLYYRLNVLSLELPPLRERGTDVLELIDNFKKRLHSDFTLANETERILLDQEWDGNIRQLKNCVEYLACLNKAEIVPDDLPADLQIKRKKTETLERCFEAQGRSEVSVPHPAFSSVSSAPHFETESVRFFPSDGSVKYAQLFLLEQMKRRAKEGKSCGRRFLLQQIRDAGYIVGEKEVRDLLQDMAAKRFIDVKKGRNGARITENGLKWFNVNK